MNNEIECLNLKLQVLEELNLAENITDLDLQVYKKIIRDLLLFIYKCKILLIAMIYL